jgi:hypothetical protein
MQFSAGCCRNNTSSEGAIAGFRRCQWHLLGRHTYLTNILNYKVILLRPQLASAAAGHCQSDDDCLRQRKFAEAAQSGEQPSNTSGAASSALISTRKRSVRARDSESRMAEKGTHEFKF